MAVSKEEWHWKSKLCSILIPEKDHLQVLRLMLIEKLEERISEGKFNNYWKEFNKDYGC